MTKKLAYILVGDHLGQVKKVLLPSGEISLLTGCAKPDKSNPVVSIESIEGKNKQLIANKNGSLYLYDCVRDTTETYDQANENLIKALPLSAKDTILIYDKQVISSGKKNNIEFAKEKKGVIKDAKINRKDNKLGLAGVDIPLKIFDIEKRTKLFEAEMPEKDWLGISPDCYVSGIDFVNQTRVATCSKSDSVIRVYDTCSKPKPIISIDINNTAFNEHAEAARFVSIASNDLSGNTIVVGSNVGQMLAIDLRFNVKQVKPKKRLQPRSYKILGGFKGARGASIKDVKIIPAYSVKKVTETQDDNEESDSYDDGRDISEDSSLSGHKVISLCLDRYLRLHNFTRNIRTLEKHVYMTTKPLRCSPVFYGN